MVLDVWQSFRMGRPLRVQAFDCNYMAADDADSYFTGLVLQDQALYSPEEVAGFGRSWQDLITTAKSCAT
jgi:hypothetical protein